MSVYRIYVEKKPEFAVEANSLIGGIKSALGLDNLTGLRVINRYDLIVGLFPPVRSEIHCAQESAL